MLDTKDEDDGEDGGDKDDTGDGGTEEGDVDEDELEKGGLPNMSFAALSSCCLWSEV